MNINDKVKANNNYFIKSINNTININYRQYFNNNYFNIDTKIKIN